MSLAERLRMLNETVAAIREDAIKNDGTKEIPTGMVMVDKRIFEDLLREVREVLS